ncbi:hypothetical protein B0H13DRAFT_1850422 [Mycena leptocephala]|nr:hypothetical protein B0H13DRAFT_1850422 [Mycena leptocephala]
MDKRTERALELSKRRHLALVVEHVGVSQERGVAAAVPEGANAGSFPVDYYADYRAANRYENVFHIEVMEEGKMLWLELFGGKGIDADAEMSSTPPLMLLHQARCRAHSSGVSFSKASSERTEPRRSLLTPRTDRDKGRKGRRGEELSKAMGLASYHFTPPKAPRADLKPIFSQAHPTFLMKLVLSAQDLTWRVFPIPNVVTDVKALKHSTIREVLE